MWQQNYYFAGESLAFSALIAAAPLLTLFYLLGIRRKAAWLSAVASLGVAGVVALVFVRMPVQQAVAATLNGAAFGLFPISWIVFSSILMYRLAVDTGKFEIIRDSIGALTADRRLQLLLIAFSFSAFIEGAAGFGSPVAVSAAMLAGLGFPPFYAALLCLIGNTAPVAFGSIGIPIVTLTQITGLPMQALSAMTGRILSIVALVVPVYLLVLMAGATNTLAVWPAVVACAVTFAATQFLVSNFIGPELTAILASLASLSAMVLLLKIWKPSRIFRLEGDDRAERPAVRHGAGATFLAWTPYLLLVIFVLAWGYKPMKAWLDATTTTTIPVPWLHNTIQRMPPVTAQPAPYAAMFVFNWLSAAGTACVLAVVAAAAVLRVVATAIRRHLQGDASPAGASDGHHRDRAGAGVPDELLRDDLHAWPGVRRNRARIPVLQRLARLARRGPDGQRDLVLCAVRQPAGRHREQPRHEPDSDRVHECGRGRDGEDDFVAEHCRCGRRHRHAGLRRREALPRHAAPQHRPGDGGRTACPDLRLFVSGSGSTGLSSRYLDHVVRLQPDRGFHGKNRHS